MLDFLFQYPVYPIGTIAIGATLVAMIAMAIFYSIARPNNFRWW